MRSAPGFTASLRGSEILMLAHPLAHFFVHLLKKLFPGFGFGLGCFGAPFVHFGESSFHLFTGASSGESAPRTAPGLTASLRGPGVLMLAHLLAHFFVHSLDEFFPGFGFGLGFFGVPFAHFGESSFHLFTGSLAWESSLRSASEETASRPATLETALRSVFLRRLGFGCVFVSVAGSFRFLVIVTPAAAAMTRFRKRPCRRQGDRQHYDHRHNSIPLHDLSPLQQKTRSRIATL